MLSQEKEHLAIDVSGAGELGRDPTVQWALSALRETCASRGLVVDDADGGFRIALRLGTDFSTGQVDAAVLAAEPEAFALVARSGGVELVARHVPGLVYAILEIEDVIRYSEQPMTEVGQLTSALSKPANPVRSITRVFSSEPEDLDWFRSARFWDEYFGELARQRINRFTLTLGMGYDYLIDLELADTYLHFPYPFLIDVAGYAVTARGIDQSERALNLEAMRYAAKAAAKRGIRFRLGLWNSGYDQKVTAPGGRLTIEGLTPETHAAYCRDALRALLVEIPEIGGLMIRAHFEGGVREPTSDFWAVVLDGLDKIDTLLDIDLHGKGVDERQLEVFARTGKELLVSAKFWGEQWGLPYHQASIRWREFWPKDSVAGHDSGSPANTGQHVPSSGITVTARRSFTRYGYGDFLKTPRPFDILYKTYPGTQRILLWGDPEQARSLGRIGSFGGAVGHEWFEPLSFKGKKGSGVAGGRELYSDPSLAQGIDSWKKYLYTYRLWGRLSYDPDAHPDMWRRPLRAWFGPAAPAIETALAAASKILPLVTVAHTPSVAGNNYWPEVYTNMPIARGADVLRNPYAAKGWPVNTDFDMEPPYNAQSVPSLDPVLFSTVEEFGASVANGMPDGRYSPLDVSDILAEQVARARAALVEAKRLAGGSLESADFRRAAVDIEIAAHLGAFFASKMRATVGYVLAERYLSVSLLKEAIADYSAARVSMAAAADVAQGVYVDDFAWGHVPYARGSWKDRLPAIDEDIAWMCRLLPIYPDQVSRHTLDDYVGNRRRTAWKAGPITTDAIAFTPGRPLEISVDAPADLHSLLLRYRHTDQSALYRSVDMVHDGARWVATIPAQYTDSPFELQYFVEARIGQIAWTFPGFSPDLASQPYWLAHRASGSN